MSWIQNIRFACLTSRPICQYQQPFRNLTAMHCQSPYSPSLSNKENRDHLNIQHKPLPHKVPPLRIIPPEPTTRQPFLLNAANNHNEQTRRYHASPPPSIANNSQLANIQKQLLSRDHIFLAALVSKLTQFAFYADMDEYIEQLDDLVRQQVDRRFHQENKNLLQVVDHIYKLKQTMAQIEEFNCVDSGGSDMFSSPQNHLNGKRQDGRSQDKIQTCINLLCESIEKFHSTIRPFSLDLQSNFSDQIALSEPTSSSCPWRQIFQTFKWTYKFVLQLLATQIPTIDNNQHPTLKQSIKSTYCKFRKFQMFITSDEPCHDVLAGMRGLNQQMEAIRSQVIKSARRDQSANN